MSVRGGLLSLLNHIHRRMAEAVSLRQLKHRVPAMVARSLEPQTDRVGRKSAIFPRHAQDLPWIARWHSEFIVAINMIPITTP